MKKLELKHLAPYLPYGLKINTIENELISIDTETKQLQSKFRGHLINIYEWDEIKPILRPLSDMDVDGEMNTPEYLQGCCYSYVQNLISQHFDVFGLIENGLAIDINTIK